MVRISDDTIQEVKSVSVLSLAEQLGYSPRREGNQHEILCPNCGAKNTFIQPAKDIFKCFGDSNTGACGCSGKGAITFYNWHEYNSKEGNNYIESVRGVAKTMGITVRDTNGKVLDENADIKVNYQRVKHIKEEPAADPDIVDKVYRTFLSLCPITKPHAEEWILQRNYSKEDIKTLLLRSVPPLGQAAQILLTLKKKGYPLERIPGFTQQFVSYEMNYPAELTTKDEKNGGYWIWMLTAKSGYFIPVRDEKGRIIRLRVRRDQGKPKYIWFSSGENIHSEKDKKRWQKGGASSGAPLNIVPPIELMPSWKGNELDDICDVSTLIATEGEHKAQISANKLKKVVAGIPGVGIFSQMLPLLQKWQVKKLVIAYDSDSLWDEEKKKRNQQVFDYLVSFANQALELGIEVCIWTWDSKHGKGLDDLLMNNRLPLEINLRTGQRSNVDLNIA